MKMIVGISAPLRTEQVAKRIKALRETLGLSKAEFADRVGIDRSSYTKIENGDKPLNIEMGYTISEIYGVPLDFIYKGQMHQLPGHLLDPLRVALAEF